MAADGRRHVIAIGGGMLVPDGRVPVHMDYALLLTGRAEPRICVLNTANGDDPQWALRMYDRFAGRPARLSHLALFPMPNVADPEDLLLSQDVIFVGGGSVANMLAVWRGHSPAPGFPQAGGGGAAGGPPRAPAGVLSLAADHHLLCPRAVAPHAPG